jgi:hypothetical protein
MKDDLVRKFWFAERIDEKEEDSAKGAHSDNDHEINGISVESSVGSRDMENEPNQKEESIFSCNYHEIDERASLFLQLKHNWPNQQ